jgi:hypothetical protein
VGGATSTTSALTFRTLTPPPVNDLCAAALPLPCGVPVTGTTEGSTTTGDPFLPCGITLVDGGGVFYTLAGTGGLVTLSTCGPNTDYDTKLFVYQSSCGGSYTCIASNDDGPGSCEQASTLSFNSANGASYLVFVAGFSDEVGRVSLLATCDPLSSKATTSQAAFRVWPNPVGAPAAFQVELPAAAGAATATLRNVLGQQVAQRTFTGAATELSTAGLASGTYLLTVQVAGQAPAVRRVVVE